MRSSQKQHHPPLVHQMPKSTDLLNYLTISTRPTVEEANPSRPMPIRVKVEVTYPSFLRD